MTGYEHQPQKVVSELIVQGTDQVRDNQFPRRKLAAKLIEFAFQPRASAKAVDGTMLCGGHQPGPWIFRDARLRPLLKRCYQRILGEVFGYAEVAHHTHQAGDEPGRFDPPDGINRPMCTAVVIAAHHDIRGLTPCLACPAASLEIPPQPPSRRQENRRIPAPGALQPRSHRPGIALPTQWLPLLISPGSSYSRQALPWLRQRARR